MPEYNSLGIIPKIYPNWMSQVDSPTYKLTLYLVKPVIWNDPTRLKNDSATINRGDAIIIAQSGTTSEYSIDNLLMISRITASNKAGNTSTGIFQFDIIEPLGFKLLDRILSLAPFYGFKNMHSANYVLKIEFQGLDPVTSKSLKYPGVFFYPLVISQINANVNAGGATYNIVASNIYKYANTNSSIATDVTITNVNNVSSFIKQTTSALNENEKNLRKVKASDNPQPKKTWKVSLGKTLSESATGDVKIRSQNFAWAGTVNSDRAGGQSASSNPEFRDITIDSETNMTSWLAETFTANVPEFAEFVERQKLNSNRTPYIVVEPVVKFGDEIDPITNLRELEIDLVMEMKFTYTNVKRDAVKQEKDARNANYQATRFLSLPISKVYNYLFSGKNTEVLDFNLSFQGLFSVALDPSAGVHYGEPSDTHAGTNLGIIETQPSESVTPSPRFLGDLKVDQVNLVTETPAYSYSNLSSSKQKVNETKGNTLSIEAVREREYARRDVDFYNIDFTIKGDPFWMGTPGAVLDDNDDALVKYLQNDALIAFINYLPDESITYPEGQKKGPLDLYSSGVYRITEVETKLQGGQFNQRLLAYKDSNTSTYLVKDLMVMLEYNNRGIK